MLLLVLCALELLMAYGSIILDAPGQRDLVQYCDIPYCGQGTHVMCLLHRKNDEMGPRCGDGKKIDITKDVQEYILSVLNEFRKKVAKGEETGKDGEPLPKAYEMNLLEWHDQLANFAQMMANNCILATDLCRSSELFHEPGQYGGFTRFTYPDWQFRGKNRPVTVHNVTKEKVLHAIRSVLHGLYADKKYATKDLVESHGERNIYMTMIYGWSTHVGCAMSAYIDYHPADDAIFNILLFYCNFSHQPSKGGPVYLTGPPPTTKSTTETTTESTTESTTEATTKTTTEATTKTTTKTTTRTTTETTTETTPVTTLATISYKMCNPVVAVFPIFKVQNAPPDDLDELSGIDSVSSSILLRSRVSSCLNSSDYNSYTTLNPMPRTKELQLLKFTPRLLNTAKQKRQFVRYTHTIRNRQFEKTSTPVPSLSHPGSLETQIDDYYLSLITYLSSNNTRYEINKRYLDPETVAPRQTYTIRRRYFDKTSAVPHTFPWITLPNSLVTLPDSGLDVATTNRDQGRFVKKESLFLKAPRFRMKSLAKNVFLNVSKLKTPAQRYIGVKGNSLNNFLSKRANGNSKKDVTSRKNFSSLGKLVSAYSLHKRFILDKLNNILKNP